MKGDLMSRFWMIKTAEDEFRVPDRLSQSIKRWQHRDTSAHDSHLANGVKASALIVPANLRSRQCGQSLDDLGEPVSRAQRQKRLRGKIRKRNGAV